MFDHVNHEKMLEILKKYNIDGKDLQIIENLCWEQSANIKIGNVYLENGCDIKSGVRQRFTLSPRLFNLLYAEEIIREARIERMGLKITDKEINEISYEQRWIEIWNEG